jgi:ribonuclease Z
MGPCTLIDTGSVGLLFDTGRGCAIRLAQARVPWRDLTQVFLTHLHADHTFALPDLYVMGWVLGRTDPLDVHGPLGTTDMMTSMIRALEPDIASRLKSVPTRTPPAYRTTEIQPGVVYDRGGVKITAFDVPHSMTPAFGYRIDAHGRSIVLSGDTRYSDTLIRHAQGVDLLVHEVVFGASTTEQQQVARAHTTPEQVAQVFAAAKPKLAMFSHLILFGTFADDVVSATRKLYDGRVEMGTDLTVIELGDRINVRRPK